MHSSARLWLAAACALAACLIIPATAGAVTADLRVEASNGKILADTAQRTSPASVKTDPGADCFGPPGGSGDRVDIPNNTALGLLADALPHDPDLRPLSITDQFSFGLALCGIGDKVASGEEFWYLKRDHTGAQVGGDQLKVHNGDEILWYLAPKYPVGDELALKAPERAQPDEPVTVKVIAYDESGQRQPDKGAKVGFGADPTNADGETEVTFPSTGHPHLQARDGNNAIPSNVEEVCVKEDPSRCPSAG
jgi:hypothetical protein